MICGVREQREGYRTAGSSVGRRNSICVDEERNSWNFLRDKNEGMYRRGLEGGEEPA